MRLVSPAEKAIDPFLCARHSGIPPSWRPRASGVRFASVPPGPAAPPSRPLMRSRTATGTPGARRTSRRSCRIANGSLKEA